MTDQPPPDHATIRIELELQNKVLRRAQAVLDALLGMTGLTNTHENTDTYL